MSSDKLDLFGIDVLTTDSAKKLLGKALLDRKDRRLIEEAIDQRLNSAAVQALIYTLTVQGVYQLERVLNPIDDPCGNKYIGFQKDLAPMLLLMENERALRGLDSKFTLDERVDESGNLRSLIRWSGGPYTFLIDMNLNSPDTKFIYPSIFSFSLDILEKENVFIDGPINFLVEAGQTILPIIGVTEISNIGKNVTYDINGKHDCKYSLDYLTM